MSTHRIAPGISPASVDRPTGSTNAHVPGSRPTGVRPSVVALRAAVQRAPVRALRRTPVRAIRRALIRAARRALGRAGRCTLHVVTLVCVPTVLTAQTTVDTLRDVAYVADPHPEQRLDLYWPPGHVTVTVLFIHGGGLTGGDRASPLYRPVCEPFIDAGIACATTDYRLAPSFQWPAMPEDVAAAVAKVRDLIESRGGDPDRLFLFGHSSGCTLAASLAANEAYLGAVGLAPSDLAGAVLMGCVLDNYDAALRGLTADDIREAFDDEDRFGTPENWISANPSYSIGPHVPPTLVVVARAERFFPAILEQGARFVRRLLEADVPAELVIVPGTHRSSIEDVSRAGDPTFAAIREFIDAPEAVADGG